MPEETQVEETTLDTPEAPVEPELIEIEDTGEDVDWQDIAKKNEELAKNYKIRAEKAETKLKRPKSEEQQTSSLSPADLIAITRANVEPEDLDEVLEFARYRKIPIHEALKSSVVKGILAEKQEIRKSAQAVNTASARRSSTQIPDDALLSAASSRGELPDGDDDIARLVKARLKKRGG